MTTKLSTNETETKSHIKEITDLLSDIQAGTLFDNSYSSDKMAIKRLFSKTNENKEAEDILLRLTVIDSMYSTQMNRRYYALEDLAKAMFDVQAKKGRLLKDLFLDFTKCPDASMFDYSEGNLFGNKYGIGKHGEQKGVAISLISKYAYFTTDYKFPIFDSIVCETLPCLLRYLGFSELECPMVKYNDKEQIIGDETMSLFVTTINTTITTLNGWAQNPVSYDALDCLLWFVGKIRRGNLSLVLSKEEYLQHIKYLENQKGGGGKLTEFDIAKINETELSSMPFVKPKLVPLFLLAKRLGSLV